MHKGVIIVAGGSGSRMNLAIPKQFFVLEGKPIIVRTVEKFFAYDPEIPIVLVLPQTHWENWFDHCAEHFTLEQNKKISLARGAETRTLSVWNGLQIFRLVHFNSFGNAPCTIAIHDAVRPFIPPHHIEECFNLCNLQKAVVSAVAVKNSLRMRTDFGTKAVDRNLFFEVHTPQVFDFELLWKSYRHRLKDDFTDDASLFEDHWKERYSVELCIGSHKNIKITTPDDLLKAELILRENPIA